MAQEDESKAPTPTKVTGSERLLHYITLISAVVGLPVVILQARPISAIVIVAIIGLGMANLLVHLWRTKLPSGDLKYGWQRWAAFIFAVSLSVSCVISFIIPSSREFVEFELLGFPGETTYASAVTLGADQKYVHILFPVTSSSTHAEEVTKVTFTVSWTNAILCMGPPTFEFTLNSALRVKQSRVSLIYGSVIAQSEAGKRYSVPVTGKSSGFCSNGDIEFEFTPPALILERDSPNVISIDIPRKITVYDLKTSSGLGDSEKMQPKFSYDMSRVLIPSPDFPEGTFVRVSAETDSGKTFSSCRKTTVSTAGVIQVANDCSQE